MTPDTPAADYTLSTDVQENIFDALDIPVITIDRSYIIQAINYSAANLVGTSPDVSIGMDLHDMLILGDERDGLDLPGQVMSGAFPCAGETTAWMGEQQTPIKYYAKPLIANDGEVSGLVLYFMEKRQKRVFSEGVRIEHDLHDGNFHLCPRCFPNIDPYL